MTKKTSAEQPAVVDKPVSKARTRTTRVTSARHTKSAVAVEAPVVQIPREDPSEAIAKIAYDYWESRGCQGGNATEDWLRAEAEYRRRIS